MDRNVQEGWIKLWRKVFESSVFDSEDHTLFKTFIYCLGRANHKENKIFMNGKEMILKPGQFITGRDEASKDLHFKGKMWDRKVDSLRKLQILTKQVTNRFTIISIINWDIYQGSYGNDDQLNDQPMTSRRPANDQPMTTDKNIKNDKNVKKKIILSDEEFLKSLKEKFTWVDFDKEMIKIDAWLMANPGRQKTRKFIVKWISKIEKPMSINKTNSTDYKKLELEGTWLKGAIDKGWKI